MTGQVLNGTSHISKILSTLYVRDIFLFMATLMPSHFV